MTEKFISRKVGVELECVAPYLTDDMHAELRGIAVVDSDGSIDVNEDGHDGYEFKIGPLTGEAAENAITAVCGVLKKAGAFVNTSCGFHVHADAKPLALDFLVQRTNGTLKSGQELLYIHNNYLASVTSGWGDSESRMAMAVIDILEDGGDMKACTGFMGDGYVIDLRGRSRNRVNPADGALVIPATRTNEFTAFAVRRTEMQSIRYRMFYAMRFLNVADSIMRSMVPASRRRNSYCKPFEKMVRSGGALPKSLREMYEGIQDRYCGINLYSLLRHGTIENRYHNATLDADKVIHWARMWARVVEVALSNSAEAEADALAEIVSQKSRTDMFFALLDLDKETERHLRARIRAFSGADADRVKGYITNKKAVCVA